MKSPEKTKSTEVRSRTASIHAEAVHVFADQAKASAWLKQKNIGLAGRAPLDLMDSEAGAAEVRRVLAAISNGGVV